MSPDCEASALGTEPLAGIKYTQWGQNNSDDICILYNIRDDICSGSSSDYVLELFIIQLSEQFYYTHTQLHLRLRLKINRVSFSVFFLFITTDIVSPLN